jgi:hypothetical protein
MVGGIQWYQIDVAGQIPKQISKLVCMGRLVIDVFNKDIFKRHTPTGSLKIVLARVNQILNGISISQRNQLPA